MPRIYDGGVKRRKNKSKKSNKRSNNRFSSNYKQ